MMTPLGPTMEHPRRAYENCSRSVPQSPPGGSKTDLTGPVGWTQNTEQSCSTKRKQHSPTQAQPAQELSSKNGEPSRPAFDACRRCFLAVREASCSARSSFSHFGIDPANTQRALTEKGKAEQSCTTQNRIPLLIVRLALRAAWLRAALAAT